MERKNKPPNPQTEVIIETPARERGVEVQEPTEADNWAALEAIGRKIKNKDWYKSLFNGRTKEQLEKEKISSDLLVRLIRNLEQGRYIGPLETQPIS